MQIIETLEENLFPQYLKTLALEVDRGRYTHAESVIIAEFLDLCKEKGVPSAIPFILQFESSSLHSRFGLTVLETTVRLLSEEKGAEPYYITVSYPEIESIRPRVIGHVKATSRRKALKSFFTQSNERALIPLIERRKGVAHLDHRAFKAHKVKELK